MRPSARRPAGHGACIGTSVARAERLCRYVARPPLALEPEQARAVRGRAPMSWMQRLRRVFDIELSHCPRCAAPLRVLGVITDPGVIAAILEHLDTRGARAPPSTSG